MRHFRIIVVSVIMCACACAEDHGRDGNFWRELGDSEKTMYLAGFFDGMILGKHFSYWGSARKDGTLPPTGWEAAHSFDKFFAKYFKHITNSQVADGMNVFYEDYRNRSIEIDSAVWLVVNEIAGKPDREMQAMIESYRQNAK